MADVVGLFFFGEWEDDRKRQDLENWGRWIR